MRLPKTINVLLLGSGGREDAFATKIAESDRVRQLYIAPGNAGTATKGVNVDLSPVNFGSLKHFVLNHNINLVVVGPELPLVQGIYDYFREDDQLHTVPIIGPSAIGAKLEGSKDFAKAFMRRNKIPTAAYCSVTKDNIDEGHEFLRAQKPPYVLKANGLAAGKGVVILNSLAKAKKELGDMLKGKFGNASSTVVLEQYLSGIECSVFVATDGKSFTILPEAKDYKRIGDGDTGPNTGGMGAVSPVPFVDKKFMTKVQKRIIEPTINGFGKEKIDYRGFIFIGLMNVDGEPYVIEYNVRMGDPETEVVIPRIESDIVDMFDRMADQSLDQYELIISPKTAVTVVCVAEGYPDDYRKGDPIKGLDQDNGSYIYHAGTIQKGKDVLTNGGRVLAVTSIGGSIEEAAQKSYQTINGIEYAGKYFRTDIGKDLI